MKSKKLQLSTLMFFQVAAVGTYLPILSIYLKDYLGFSAIQVGVILSLASIPSIASPFISAWVVDRIITSRRMLIIYQIAAGILIIIMSFERSYSAVLITYFIYSLNLIPTFALVNTLVFHYMEDRNSYAGIRFWGTIGWILAGLMMSFIWKLTPGAGYLPLALQFSALFSIFVVLITLKLPKLELKKDKKIDLIPYDAITVLKNPEVLLLFFLVFVIATADKFLMYGMPIFLSQNGIAKDNILIILSLGQIPEAIMLFTLATIIKKLGFKNIFTIALILQVIRYTIFYFNGPLPLTLLGILIHGFIYALFYIGSTIYLDNFTDKKSRGGVHQIFSLIFVGMAGLLGNLAAGYVANNVLIDGVINFKIFWLIPGLMSAVVLVIMSLFMKRHSHR